MDWTENEGKKQPMSKEKLEKLGLPKELVLKSTIETLKQNSGSLQAKYEDKQCCSEYVICAISYFSQNNSRIIV